MYMYIAMDVNRSGLEFGLENDSVPWIDKSGDVQCIVIDRIAAYLSISRAPNFLFSYTLSFNCFTTI